MARIRTIKPEFPQSESMGRVSRDARLLFIMLWTICDDSGRARGNSRMLASLLFPYDEDAPTKIEDWLHELEEENCLVRYVVDGSTYLQICKWLNHQKIDKPSQSKIPPFDESSRIFSKPRESSPLDQGSRTKDLRIKEGNDDSGDLSKRRAREKEPSSLSSTPEGNQSHDPFERDPIAQRSVEISVLLRNHGAAVQPGNPHLLEWARAGLSDAKLLSALEQAQAQRKEQSNPQPVNAGYLNSILQSKARAGPANSNSGKSLFEQNMENALRAKAMIFGDQNDEAN